MKTIFFVRLATLLFVVWALPSPALTSEEILNPIADRLRCTSQDFSNQLGPVRDQQSRGTCWAYAVSDLITQALGIRPPEQISSYDVAIQAYLGETGKIRDLAAKFGPQTILSKNVAFDSTRGKWAREIQERSRLKAYGDLIGQNGEMGMAEAIYSYNFVNGVCFERQLRSTPDGSQLQGGNAVPDIEAALKRNQKLLESCSCNRATDNFLKDLAIIQNELLKKLTEDHCNPRTAQKSPLIPKQVRFDLQGGDPIREIDDAFAKNRSIALSVDAQKLFYSGASGEHAIVVVGRTWSETNSSCEYKIRNSWGTRCKGEVLGAKCLDDGTFIVNADKIRSMTIESVWIPPAF
ncbi:MAG: hypothetical protein KDD22_05335 [Bdellovibrionales bacterium]|nr:hypothetical protein [Bdellovibrionales bacterium]